MPEGTKEELPAIGRASGGEKVRPELIKKKKITLPKLPTLLEEMLFLCFF